MASALPVGKRRLP